MLLYQSSINPQACDNQTVHCGVGYSFAKYLPRAGSCVAKSVQICVSTVKNFVKERLWGSITARKILEAKLKRQWRETATKVRKVVNTSKEIYFLTCDNTMVVTLNSSLSFKCCIIVACKFNMKICKLNNRKSSVTMSV